ncbi:MAG: translation initiation factor IF-2 [Simkaniaceae bacterium]|nr:MAG: translation initiation factor IF-2 [Simkaniaceae bacterium]
MAKSLKLKVKNAQLAEAIKLNKAKKEEKEEKEASKNKAPAKAKVETKKAASTTEKAAPKEKAAESTKGNVNPPVQKEEEKAKKEAPPTKTPSIKTDKAPVPKSKTIEPKKEKKENAEQKSVGALKKREKERPEPPKQEEKGFKANFGRNSRGTQKRQDSRFDARDRKGLRVGEERIWRRRPRRYRPKRDESDIIRPKELAVRLPISVKDLAQGMKLKASELISKLFMQGIAITINDYLEDETTIQLLGHEFGCEITIDTSAEERLRITDETIQEEIEKTDPEHLKGRAPIVAFMGHVDHGKTSLIDAIRKSNIASGEAGAITQHIGAFKCQREQGDITILDTPGHEAFTLMRQRGTAVTDVIVLVIAGDEGLMPQTEEAINLAKVAKVPMVVAINKCDKQGFNVDNVYRQLADKELLPEAWGGTVITVNCSAESGEGVSTLLEMLALQSEILELKANPDTRARGSVIESQMHKGFGPVATVLVQNGTLKLGDALVFEDLYARVKTMHDEHGKGIPLAGPATPVKITGLSGVPAAGSEFIVVENEKEARKLAEERASGEKHKKLQRGRGELESYMTRHQELEEKKVVPLILRADVQGSVEAIKNSLLGIKSKKVELNFISEGVGEISESDVELAAASNAVIIGFHTQVESHAEDLIKRNKVIIKKRDIIYQIIDDVKGLMLDSLDKVRHETEKGTAEVKQVFKSSHLGSIAGCMMTDGSIKRDYYAKVVRDGEIIHEGEISSLKRVKEDVKEVNKGLECGILLNKFTDYQEGDLIKGFEITYISQDL